MISHYDGKFYSNRKKFKNYLKFVFTNGKLCVKITIVVNIGV